MGSVCPSLGRRTNCQLLKEIDAQQAHLQEGHPGGQRCSRGRGRTDWSGSIEEVERLKAKGASVEWKTYGLDSPGDYIPVLTQGLLVTKKASRPHLDRLFVSWFALEGITIAEKLEFRFRVTHQGSYLNKLIKERAPNAKVLAPLTKKDFEIYTAFEEQVTKMIAGGIAGR